MKNMKFLGSLAIIMIVGLSLAGFFSILLLETEKQNTVIPVHTDAVPLQYVGKIKVSGISVRLLVLKHCFEKMADDDAEMVIQGANLAATKGLDIKGIGNHYINSNGQARLWGEKYTLDKLKNFVSQQMKINAEPGDTIVIFTVGHGSNGGYLQDLGQRREVMEAFAQAAEENNQETLWWQLSCYAAANLPSINSLTPAQQDLFSVVTSSDANTPSPAYVEGKIMEKFFVALAEDSSKIDTDSDELITAGEISNFVSNRKIYSKSMQEVVFGFSWARRLPIFDRDGKNREYPKDFIPLPNK